MKDVKLHKSENAYKVRTVGLHTRRWLALLTEYLVVLEARFRVCKRRFLQLLPRREFPCTVLSVYDLVQARISISEYIFLSVYEMASKFSARCARRLFLKKNIVKQGQNNWRIQFFTGYDYLWTRKPNTRIYTNKRISLPRDPKT